MNIAGLQKLSTIDFPKVLAAVLFTSGCNASCFYCHNQNLTTENVSLLSEEAVKSFLTKRAGMLEGIVLSGGEPTLQKDLSDFMAFIKKLGYQTKLDTNGSNPLVVKSLLAHGLLDYTAVDFKTTPETYTKLTGFHFSNTAWSVKLLKESGLPFELRTTLYPGLTLQDLRIMSDYVPDGMPWYLQQFRPTPAIPHEGGALRPETAYEALTGCRKNVRVRGLSY